jgi:beta-lactamase regulating signal transducer with metallopeptidase domain
MAWLITWLWQGIAVTLTAALLLALARRVNASARHAIWWAALVAVLGLPALATLGTRAVPATAAPVAAGPVAAPLVAPLVVPAVPDWALSILIGGWLGFVLVRAVRVVRSFAYVQRLKTECEPMPAEQERRLAGWMVARRGRPRTTLAVSESISMPAALGLGRPVIVLPASLASDLDPDDLDRIVLHELAHLSRHDDWTRLAQAVIDCVAGLHPAVWWIGRQIDLEREAACDDFVVAHTGEALRYASSLAAAAECARRGGDRRRALDQALAPGAARAGGALVLRVRRIVDRRRGRRPWPAAASFGASALAVALSVAALAPLSAVVSIVDAVPDAARAPLVLASRVFDGGHSGPAPRVTSRPAAFGRRTAVVRPALDAGLAPVREHAEPFAASPGVPVEALPADGVSMLSPEIQAVPISARIGHGLSVARLDVSGRGAIDTAGPRGLWPDVAGAGAAVGSGLKQAGQATAGFFARAGVTIARAF